ncbi:GNAT family N-acetyltransferase [Aurantivibrio plasticivorans]
MAKWHHCFVDSISAIGSQQWQTLFGQNSVFLRYEFLHALEHSGCTTKEAGWQPHHLQITDNDTTVAIVPMYIKTDSYGEYVFDWSWADAYHRYGIPYYPKLVTAIPFTPATGTRWAKLPSVDEAHLISYISTAINAEIKRLNASSWHCLFPNQDQSNVLREHNTLQRIGCQYHWINNHYANFDDFLTTFNSRKRKNLKKERARVKEQGVTLLRKTGDEITEQEWETFYRFYHYTYLKRSGRQGYLNKMFFKSLADNLNDAVMMVVAEKNTDIIAASLFFYDETTLYGRYWGCEQEQEFLHFEACYYQGIEFAIEQGLKRFDPGAQGEHKIQRGFTPTLTYSNHTIANEQFREAIARFIEEETQQVQRYCEHA